MITNSGLIEDYTTDGVKNRTFPKLQKTHYSYDSSDVKGSTYSTIPYNIYGVYFSSVLHFISCDPHASVKIYHIDNDRMESIPDSKIPEF